MDRELNQADGRKLYVPPQLVTISLRPEEAVLGSCKISGSAGPNSSSSCMTLLCMAIAS